MRCAWLLLVTACSGSGSTPTPEPPLAAPLDPLGPCQRIDGNRCLAHDPLFAEATAAAEVKPPVASARTRRYLARIATPGSVELAVDLPTVGTVHFYRWAPGHDGWVAGTDAFTSAEPGASWSIAFAGQPGQRIAVIADTDVVVHLRPR